MAKRCGYERDADGERTNDEAQLLPLPARGSPQADDERRERQDRSDPEYGHGDGRHDLGSVDAQRVVDIGKLDAVEGSGCEGRRSGPDEQRGQDRPQERPPAPRRRTTVREEQEQERERHHDRREPEPGLDPGGDLEARRSGAHDV